MRPPRQPLLALPLEGRLLERHLLVPAPEDPVEVEVVDEVASVAAASTFPSLLREHPTTTTG